MKLVVTQLDQAPAPSISVATGIVAQPGGLAGATILSANHNIVTTVASGSGVKLQVTADGVQEVLNRGALPLAVYPSDGTALEGLGTGTPITLAPDSSQTFEFDGTATWVMPSSGSSGGVISITAGAGLSGGTITTNGTLALAPIVASSLLGNPTGGSSTPQPIAIGSGLRVANGALNVDGGGGATVTTAVGTDLIQIQQSGTYALISAVNLFLALGETVAQGTAAAAISDTDSIWVNQGGNSDVVATFSGLWSWMQGKLSGYQPATVPVTVSRTLDRTSDNRRQLVVTASNITLSLANGTADPARNNLGDGFETTILNLSATDATLDALITTNTGAHTIAPDASARVVAVSQGTTTAVFAQLFGAAAGQGIAFSAYSPSPAAITAGNSSVAVTLSGALSGYGSAPTLNYSTDGATFSALPVGNSVSATAFSFALTLATTTTVYVRDAAQTTVANNQSVTIEKATLASTPTTGTQGTALNLSAAVLTLGGITTVYAVLAATSGGADEGSRAAVTAANFAAASLVPQSSGAGYVLRIYDAATSGNKLAESSAINVAAGTQTLTLNAIGTTQYTDETTMPVGGTYSVGIPSAMNYAFTGGANPTGTVTITSATGGNWTGTIPLPAVGSYTLSVTGTAGNTASSGTQSATVAAATITPTAPSGASAGSSFALAGTWAGSLPLTGVDYSWDGGTTWATATGTPSISGANWSGLSGTAPAAGTYTLTVRRTNHTSVTGAVSGVVVGSASPFSLTSFTPTVASSDMATAGKVLLPTAIGQAGQTVNFSGQYSGTPPGAVTATAAPLGGSASAISLSGVTYSAGTMTFSLTAPATPGSYTLSLSWSGGSATTTFFAQAGASVPYDAWPTSTGGLNQVAGPLTRPNVLITTDSFYMITGGTGVIHFGGTIPGGTTQAGLTQIICGASQSRVAPPPGASSGTTANSSPYLMRLATIESPGANQYWGLTSPEVFTADSAGAYYVWYMTNDGYALVGPSTTTFT